MRRGTKLPAKSTAAGDPRVLGGHSDPDRDHSPGDPHRTGEARQCEQLIESGPPFRNRRVGEGQDESVDDVIGNGFTGPDRPLKIVPGLVDAGQWGTAAASGQFDRGRGESGPCGVQRAGTQPRRHAVQTARVAEEDEWRGAGAGRRPQDARGLADGDVVFEDAVVDAAVREDLHGRAFRERGRSRATYRPTVTPEGSTL